MRFQAEHAAANTQFSAEKTKTASVAAKLGILLRQERDSDKSACVNLNLERKLRRKSYSPSLSLFTCWAPPLYLCQINVKYCSAECVESGEWNMDTSARRAS